MFYHNLIWLMVGLAVVAGVLTIGVVVYSIFFED